MLSPVGTRTYSSTCSHLLYTGLHFILQHVEVHLRVHFLLVAEEVGETLDSLR